MATLKVISNEPDARRAYWSAEIERARKRFYTFWEAGDRVVDEYRIQKADGNDAVSQDKYNILYSSTETIRPNLYSQTPLPRVVLRSKDTATDPARAAAVLLEGCLSYVMNEEDIDELMDQAVEDYLLPGLGVAFVRYEANFTDDIDPTTGGPIPDPTNPKQNQQILLDEMVKIEYVYWQDFVCGVARSWKEVPWVAKRLYLTKEEAVRRFGTEKASQLNYVSREAGNRDRDNPSDTAEAWEIWSKSNKMVYWYAESFPGDLLDIKPDPLKLKNFYPCPRPLRAISNTRTFVPRALYSQYKSQAQTLNVMTKRIRLLGEALRVVGLFDGSQVKLADVLNPAAGNRMIAVDSWATFAQNGGIKGSVQWVPIDIIVQVLTQLQAAREVAKTEIYEITGFSDIQRGVSKASETLGAQNIKTDWATARVKKMQGEVQRFVRDLIALAGEIIAEHCDPVTIAIFSGVPIPDPQEVAQNPQLQQQVALFKQATDLLKNELRRVSTVEIETDSTLLANEEQERDDRTKFLAAAGAFLQQAVPAAQATPELGPLLGAMLMFVVRTFPSSRPVEEEFEKVQQAFVANSQNPQNQDKDGNQAKTAAQLQIAQMEQQTAQARIQAESSLKQAELQIRSQHEGATTANTTAAENNRHQEKMLELQLHAEELKLRQQELQQGVSKNLIAKEHEDTLKFTALHNAALAEISALGDFAQAASTENMEYDKMAHTTSENDLDRTHEHDENQAALDAAQELQDTAPEPQEPQDGGGGPQRGGGTGNGATPPSGA